MAKKTKDESPLSAFEGVISNLSGNLTTEDDVAKLDDINSVDDDDDEVIDLSIKPKKDDTKVAPSEEDEEGSKTIKVDEPKNEDDESEEDGDKNINIDFSDDDDDNNEPINEDAESSQVGLFFDAFSEALGWEINENEEKPNTIEDLIDYMRDLVEENSTPEYSSEQVKELDEFIKNGGKFEDFYEASNKLTNLKDLDMEDESNQKQVLKEWLKISGYTDSQINRKIERWEDAGVLEDEANDSLELLTEHREKEKAEMIKKQEEARIKQEKAQKEFYNDVIKTIDNLTEIRGIKIPAEDRKKLKDYAFKVEADGTTKYQKEYAKNIAKNFVESAYFTMKGDALTSSAKKAGESSAVAKLRQSMKNRTPGNSKHNIDNSSAAPIWKAASSFFGVRS